MNVKRFVTDQSVGFPIVSQEVRRDPDPAALDWAAALTEGHQDDPDGVEPTVDGIIGDNMPDDLSEEAMARLQALPPEIREQILRTMGRGETPRELTPAPPTVLSEMLRLQKVRGKKMTMIKPTPKSWWEEGEPSVPGPDEKDEDEDEDEDEKPKGKRKKPMHRCKSCMDLGYIVISDRAGGRHTVACRHCSNPRMAQLDDDDIEPDWDPCPRCGGHAKLLGHMNQVTHLRCRDCGWDYQQSPDEGPETSRTAGIAWDNPPYSVNDQERVRRNDYRNQEGSKEPEFIAKSRIGWLIKVGDDLFVDEGDGDWKPIEPMMAIQHFGPEIAAKIGVERNPLAGTRDIPEPRGEVLKRDDRRPDPLNPSWSPRHEQRGSNNTDRFIHLAQQGHRYDLGDVRLPQLELDPRGENLPGHISIGGDNGDVQADGASMYDDGVVLHGTVLISSMPNLPPASQIELLQDVVYAAFESAGPDIFRPVKDRPLPPDQGSRGVPSSDPESPDFVEDDELGAASDMLGQLESGKMYEGKTLAPGHQSFTDEVRRIDELKRRKHQEAMRSQELSGRYPNQRHWFSDTRGPEEDGRMSAANPRFVRLAAVPGDPCPKCDGTGKYTKGRFKDHPGMCFACLGTGRIQEKRTAQEERPSLLEERPDLRDIFLRWNGATGDEKQRLFQEILRLYNTGPDGDPENTRRHTREAQVKGGYLRGESYAHKLCAECTAAIDQIADLYESGDMPDSDDPEAPIMYVYDHRMFCGGHECVNRPMVDAPPVWTAEDLDRIYGPEEPISDEARAAEEERQARDLAERDEARAIAHNRVMTQMVEQEMAQRARGINASQRFTRLAQGQDPIFGRGGIQGQRPTIDPKWTGLLQQFGLGSPRGGAQPAPNPYGAPAQTGQQAQQVGQQAQQPQGGYQTMVAGDGSSVEKDEYMQGHAAAINLIPKVRSISAPGFQGVDNPVNRQAPPPGSSPSYQKGWTEALQSVASEGTRFVKLAFDLDPDEWDSRHGNQPDAIGPQGIDESIPPGPQGIDESIPGDLPAGGHLRETPEQAGAKPIYQDEDMLILQDNESGNYEMFQRSDDYAGYTIRIGGRGYEFVRTLSPEELESLVGDQGDGGMPQDQEQDSFSDLPTTDQLTSDMDLRRQLQLDQGSVDPRTLRDFQEAPINMPSAYTGLMQDRRLSREPWAGTNPRFVRLAQVRPVTIPFSQPGVVSGTYDGYRGNSNDPAKLTQQNVINPWMDAVREVDNPNPNDPRHARWQLQRSHEDLWKIDQQLRDPRTTPQQKQALHAAKVQLMGRAYAHRQLYNMPGGGNTAANLTKAYQSYIKPAASYQALLPRDQRGTPADQPIAQSASWNPEMIREANAFRRLLKGGGELLKRAPKAPRPSAAVRERLEQVIRQRVEDATSDMPLAIPHPSVRPGALPAVRNQQVPALSSPAYRPISPTSPFANVRELAKPGPRNQGQLRGKIMDLDASARPAGRFVRLAQMPTIDMNPMSALTGGIDSDAQFIMGPGGLQPNMSSLMGINRERMSENRRMRQVRKMDPKVTWWDRLQGFMNPGEYNQRTMGDILQAQRAQGRPQVGGPMVTGTEGPQGHALAQQRLQREWSQMPEEDLLRMLNADPQRLQRALQLANSRGQGQTTNPTMTPRGPWQPGLTFPPNTDPNRVGGPENDGYPNS